MLLRTALVAATAAAAEVEADGDAGLLGFGAAGCSPAAEPASFLPPGPNPGPASTELSGGAPASGSWTVAGPSVTPTTEAPSELGASATAASISLLLPLVSVLPVPVVSPPAATPDVLLVGLPLSSPPSPTWPPAQPGFPPLGPATGEGVGAGVPPLPPAPSGAIASEPSPVPTSAESASVAELALTPTGVAVLAGAPASPLAAVACTAVAEASTTVEAAGAGAAGCVTGPSVGAGGAGTPIPAPPPPGASVAGMAGSATVATFTVACPVT